MLKVIHQSWSAAAERAAAAPAGVVALDFAGTFIEGTYEGTVFAGRIQYDPAAAPTERHSSYALYEDWPSPIVTMAVGGQVLAAQGAAVYDSIFDGTASQFDFVTLFGTGPFDGGENSAFFELLLTDEDASTLGGLDMPSSRQLCNFPVKKVSFGTDAPGNVVSVGVFTLSAPG